MSRQRRTVRIVEKRTIPRAAYVSLAAAAASAALLFALWRALKSDDLEIPLARSIEDVQLEWRCEDGHIFTAPGAATPIPCPTCGKDAYPIAQFQCPVHGQFDVFFRFEKGPDGRLVPTEVKAVGGKWEPFTEHPRCPKCHRPMIRESVDPLATKQDPGSG